MIAGNNLHPLSSDDINKIDEFRKAKQTAVLAILFSDIVNSTYAAEKYGEQAYSKIRHIHDELFIRIMTQDNAGRIIKEIGDSFLCVFSEPSTAVLRAIEFQNAIYSNADNLRINDFSLKVKIGIHIGQVAVENNFALDIFGRHVNRASRIQSIAKGGQILTSQSVWENAVGWLKGHDDKNIKWISYGKTKLKGIKESVDIYCFYSAITGKPPLPETIKINKQRRTILLVAVLLAIVAISFFASRKIGQVKQDAIVAAQLSAKKVYYVQFDFSTLLKNSLDKNTIIDIDTLALKDKLLSQVIAVLYPDSVIEELDLKESLSRKGIFYTRHMKGNSLDGRYFQDTLKVSGIIDIRPSQLLSQIDTEINKDSFGFRKHVSQGGKLNDSILIRINVQLFSKYGVKGKDGYHWESMNNIRNDFRNHLQDAIMSFKADIIQGLVTNCSDSFFFFKLNHEAYLRKGSQIKLSRSYSGSGGLNIWLKDVQDKIDYFNNKPQFVEDLNYAESSYEHVKSNLSSSLLNSNVSYGEYIEISGRVIELYDSTGKVKWKVMGNYLLDKPRVGDKVFLSY